MRRALSLGAEKFLPPSFRYIFFAPRNSQQHAILQEQAAVLLPTSPAHVHVSDLNGIEKEFGLFT